MTESNQENQTITGMGHEKERERESTDAFPFMRSEGATHCMKKLFNPLPGFTNVHDVHLLINPSYHARNEWKVLQVEILVDLRQQRSRQRETLRSCRRGGKGEETSVAR